jgi:hypothetical protein
VEVDAGVVEQYADFAAYAAADSPCFEAWAHGVVTDLETQAWLATLPAPKRQPNLVFAAARWHGVPAPGPYAGLRDALLGDDGSIRATILARATQTNEVGRLATLVPAFASLAPARPLALLEVGASAGLCLYPDRWGYAWRSVDRVHRLGPAPRLVCEVDGPAPLPLGLPHVAWRAGIDLDPVDVRDDEAMAWLETLVWPEDDERRSRLTHAVGLVRAEPPRLVRGDLLDELPTLVEEAAAQARSATVVVFHSAVVAYLEPAARERFTALMRDLVGRGACRWVSNEGPRVLPDVTATAGREVPRARFVLGVDGRAVAFTHGHGRSLTWLPARP